MMSDVRAKFYFRKNLVKVKNHSKQEEKKKQRLKIFVEPLRMRRAAINDFEELGVHEKLHRTKRELMNGRFPTTNIITNKIKYIKCLETGPIVVGRIGIEQLWIAIEIWSNRWD